MKKFRLLLLALSIAGGMTTACHSTHNHGAQEEHEEHAAVEKQTYTIYDRNNRYELFFESTPFIENEKAELLVHVTRLPEYKPLQQGSLKLLYNNQLVASANQPEVPGIFHLAFSPKKIGSIDLKMELTDKGVPVLFPLNNINVYENHDAFHESQQEHHENAKAIAFLKEEAWKIDFAVAPVKEEPFFEIIKTSGEIMPAQGDEIVVTAKHRGTVLLGGTQLLSGEPVKKNEELMTLSASLLDGNLNQDYLKAKAAYDKAKENYERSKQLIEDRLITQTEFRSAEAEFRSAKAVFENISRFHTTQGERIVAPQNGYIKECLVSEGQFVEAGQALMVITQNRKLTLRADVPQKDYARLPSVFSANFITPYDQQVHSIDNLGGKKITFGKSTLDKTFFTPVYFEVINTENLIPGSYVEVYLKAGSFQDALTIPLSSLMEEQGNFYVFVQKDGEEYLKRYITPGRNDGKRLEVLSGLEAGERVVAKGAYRVKLASMSGTAPAHNHNH
ncbi:efflux RND transporter periplasmic adaptor subunit [Prolixibacter denitrificans]|uniref:RND family efflux transporter MFP subunit n=2 Tax=Prolixibacter denitrificans TaxID=1541063 RepID=A0A2P8CBL0_9BACT|nr:efflux RND transporter periplasmic adaptor subunit [Prolixibacter denitrificans]PSK82360.1 RND family efflux transporter MFP subunit [Prolixibacter denitrificans]